MVHIKNLTLHSSSYSNFYYLVSACCESTQNGCCETACHCNNEECTDNDCNDCHDVKPQQNHRTTQRSVSASSDENCFDIEIDKEGGDDKLNNETKLDKLVEDDEKPAMEKSTNIVKTSRKHPRFAHQDSWKHALKKAMNMPDPWEVFHLDMCVQETATRHRYNALKKTWVQDKVRIKMESTVSDSTSLRSYFDPNLMGEMFFLNISECKYFVCPQI